MEFKKLDDAIRQVEYVLDCLIALRNIYKTGGDCNSCKVQGCGIKPKLGEQIRFNCPYYRGEILPCSVCGYRGKTCTNPESPNYGKTILDGMGCRMGEYIMTEGPKK